MQEVILSPSDYRDYPSPKSVRFNYCGTTTTGQAISENKKFVSVVHGDRETLVLKSQIEWLEESSISPQKSPTEQALTAAHVSEHPAEDSGAFSRDFKIGDRVWFGEPSTTGEIEYIDGAFASVLFDHGKSADGINLSRLHPTDTPKQVPPPPRKPRKGGKNRDFRNDAPSIATTGQTDGQIGNYPSEPGAESGQQKLDCSRFSPAGEAGVHLAETRDAEILQDDRGIRSAWPETPSTEISATEIVVPEASQLSLMSAEEARDTIARINAGILTVGELLLDLHDRQGWKALGYSSWRECAVSEFEASQSHVYNKLKAAQIKREIGESDSTIVEIPYSRLLPLKDLPEGTRKDAWQEANAIAAESGREVTAAIVSQVVEKRLEPREIQATFDLTDDLATPTWEQIKTVYAQIGQVKPFESGIAVEGKGFSVVLPSREAAWKAWQSKYKGFLQEPVIQVPESAIAVPKSHPAGVLASAKTSHHPTPEHLWRPGLECFGVERFGLDPASYEGSPIPCDRTFTAEDNGLEQHWQANTLWSNFPYSDGEGRSWMGRWVSKLIHHYQAGDVKQALTLVKSDCRPEWFENLFYASTAYCFVWGAQKFLGNEHSSFFGCVIFYLGPDVDRFYRAYEHLGGIGQQLNPEMFGE